MSELIKERIKASLEKTATIFLHNNFRFKGKIINCDNEYLELLDFKTNNYKIIVLEEIKEIEVENGERKE